MSIMTMSAGINPINIILNTTFTKTATLGTTWAFTYTSGMAAGSFVVMCVTYRSSSNTLPTPYTSIADSAGNSFTLANAYTQSNNLTYTGIYYGTLSAAVTTATTVTVTASASATMAAAQYTSVFQVVGVGPRSQFIINMAQSGTSWSNSSVLVSPNKGAAFSVTSTGTGTPPTVNSLNTGWSTGSTLTATSCSHYTQTYAMQSNVATTQAQFNTNTTANWVAITAIFI